MTESGGAGAAGGLLGRNSPPDSVVWDAIRAALDAASGVDGPGAAPGGVLDVGGGSGVLAVPLAGLGHDVTVVDPSPDALATLRRRADSAGVGDRVRGVQGDADTLSELVPADSARMVLCHSVLEYVDDPAATVASIARVVRPDGWLSLLAATRVGAVFARALTGHYAESLAVLDSEHGRWGAADGMLRRFDVPDLERLLARADLTIEQVHGVRVLGVLADQLAAGREPDPCHDDELLNQLERTLATRAPYRDLATQVHVLARRG